MNRQELYHHLYDLRFELFFGSQIAILFGSLVLPLEFYEATISPLLFLINLGMGILLISHRKRVVVFFSTLFIISLITFGLGFLSKPIESGITEYMRLAVYFTFYTVVTIEVIAQIWKIKTVTKNVIIGLMSGYISIGLLGFFLFVTIEIINPGSFSGPLMGESDFGAKIDSLIYYSYITLLTIGYGEIYPISPVAQKAAILVGLMGQFYLVIVTAVVVEKYIRHSEGSAK